MNLKRFGVNDLGRDIAVGDIHGYFTKLQSSLDSIDFNPEVDRLFSVGDLVDRGPESNQAIKWLNKPWFHAVRGNHDDYVCRYDSNEIGKWSTTAGKWFSSMAPNLQSVWAHVFDKLPLAIELQTPNGVIGIVHADCTLFKWSQLVEELETPTSCERRKLIKNCCLWSRSRLELNETHGVEGIRALIVGHSPVTEMLVLGNVHFIDTTGGQPRGRYTFLDLNTLEIIY